MNWDLQLVQPIIRQSPVYTMAEEKLEEIIVKGCSQLTGAVKSFQVFITALREVFNG